MTTDELLGALPHDLADALRERASERGVDEETLVIDAVRRYLSTPPAGDVRNDVLVHLEASIEANRELYRLLSQ